MEAIVKKRKARVASTTITLSTTSTLATTKIMIIAASTLAWHCF